jgi:hypothetical protein
MVLINAAWGSSLERNEEQDPCLHGLPVERASEEDGFAHQDGRRPRKGPLFGGSPLPIETGPEFRSVSERDIPMSEALKSSRKERNAVQSGQIIIGHLVRFPRAQITHWPSRAGELRGIGVSRPEMRPRSRRFRLGR